MPPSSIFDDLVAEEQQQQQPTSKPSVFDELRFEEEQGKPQSVGSYSVADRVKDIAKNYGVGSGYLAGGIGKGGEMLGRAIEEHGTDIAKVAPQTMIADKAAGLAAKMLGKEPEYEQFKEKVADRAQNVATTAGKTVQAAGRKVQEAGDVTSEYWTGKLSESGRQLSEMPWYKADGIGNKVMSATLQAARSAPETIAIGMAGGPVSTAMKSIGVGSMLTNALARTGVSKKLAPKIASWVEEGLAYGSAEGMMAGLSNAKQVGEEIERMDHAKLLAGSPAYQEYYNQTGDEAEAKKLLKDDAEAMALGATAVLSTATGAAAGGGLFDKTLTSKNFLLNRVLGGAKEAHQEFWQSGIGEALPANLAMRKAEPDREAMEGVWEEGAAGAGPGFIMGLFGASGGRHEQEGGQDETGPSVAYLNNQAVTELKKRNLPTRDLLRLKNNPEIGRLGIEPRHIDAILAERAQDLEQARFALGGDEQGPLTRAAKQTVRGQQAEIILGLDKDRRERQLAADSAAFDKEYSQYQPEVPEPREAIVEEIRKEAEKEEIISDGEQFRRDLEEIEKLDPKVRKYAEQKAEEIVNADPVYAHMDEARKRGLDLNALQKDYDKDTTTAIARKYPAIFSYNGRVRPDEFAQEKGYESLDHMIQAFMTAPQKSSLIRKIAKEEAENFKHYDNLMERDSAREWTGAGKPLTVDKKDTVSYPAPDADIDAMVEMIRANPETFSDEDLDHWTFTSAQKARLRAARRGEEIKRTGARPGAAYTMAQPPREGTGATETTAAAETGKEEGGKERGEFIPAATGPVVPQGQSAQDFLIRQQATGTSAAGNLEKQAAIPEKYSGRSDDFKKGYADFLTGRERVEPREYHGSGKGAEWYRGWDAANVEAPVMFQKQPAGEMQRGPAIPDFKSSNEINEWLEAQAEAKGMSLVEFTTTDEYKSVHSQLRQKFDELRKQEKETEAADARIVKPVRREDGKYWLKFSKGKGYVAAPGAFGALSGTAQQFDTEQEALEWAEKEGYTIEPQPQEADHGLQQEGQGKTEVVPPGFGQDNKVFTKDAAEKAREILRAKLKTQLSAGLDPEMMQAGITLAGYYIEGGTRKFADYSKAMINDLGEGIKPYLKAFYDAIRSWPGFNTEGMSTPEQVERYLAEEGAGAKLPKPPKGEEESAQAPHDRLAEKITGKLKARERISWAGLFKMADEAYGGTQAEGKYVAKDAYDAMELGVNKYLLEKGFGNYSTNIFFGGNTSLATQAVLDLKELIDLLPTQTRRSAEQDEFQQFSTPPPLAYLANWAANLNGNDVYLEPSAGIGGLAVFGKMAGAEVIVNELSDRRRGLLASMGFDRVTGENAEHLNSILPKDIKPTVIVMNPPFSATAGRIEGKRDTRIGAQHIEQALKRLQPGGRLVAIVGEGMAHDKPAFREWWRKIEAEYTVRANVGMSGKEYRKYGTTFDNQLLIIDKTGPTSDNIIKDRVEKVEDLVPLLEEVRNARNARTTESTARPEVQPDTTQPVRQEEAKTGQGEEQPGGTVLPAAGDVGPGQRDTIPGSRPNQGTLGIPPVSSRPAEGNEVPPGGTQPDDRTGREPEPAGSGRSDTDALDQQTAGGGGGLHGRTDAVPRLTVEAVDQKRTEALTDSVYENYSPERLKIPGAKPHPTSLVQSAAMASVKPPKPTYSPSIPQRAIEAGKISDIQMEAVVYAGQAMDKMLPDGETRQGYFIGDGTGVGKGREIAAILWDNWNKGRKKGVWISEKKPLFEDAKRDLRGVGWRDNQLTNHGKVKATDNIPGKEGILFTTYDTVKSGERREGGRSRLDQIVEWLGEDFDGVIVFDEAHNMGNSIPVRKRRGRSKPSEKALAGIELQRRLPNARVLYVSATGASEVMNLAYADRLGLWGRGTPFANKIEFVNQISSGGMAVMEMVARDMKARGIYTARSLSYDGVEYDRLEHVLSDNQRSAYDRMAEAWQIVLRNINAALEITGGGESSTAKSAAMSAFWGSHQRFFNQYLISLQMPSVIKQMRKDLEAGHSIVVQLTSTYEAAQERGLAKIDEGSSLEDLDISPFDSLMEFVQNSFPVAQFQPVMDQDGNITMEIVKDSEGNIVQNADAVAMREQLLDELGALRKDVAESPIDQIIDEFGLDVVGEVTGRKRRVVWKETEDRGRQRVIEKRPASSGPADAQAFMDDKRRILIFSQAGGTGRSYHADRSEKNQRKRIHYLLQPGWRADLAIQGLGRTHRSNQAHPPKYILVTTDLKGQKRFLSTIARRLDQLGALTKGQRQTGSQGIFVARDNLESQYATDALRRFFVDLVNGQIVNLTVQEFEEQTGLKLVDDQGGINTSDLPSIQQFLNRLLSLNIETMDMVFDEFSSRMDAIIEAHARAGTLDVGMETLHADSVEKVQDEVVHIEERTGAETKYVKLKTVNPAPILTFEAAQNNYAGKGFYRNKTSGKVWAVTVRNVTNRETGDVVETAVLRSVTYSEQRVRMDEFTPEKWERLLPRKARELWGAEIEKAPKTVTRDVHMIAGALLPVWDRLHGGHSRVMRVQTDQGERMIGRIIPESNLEDTLQRLGVSLQDGATKVNLSAEEIHSRVLDQNYEIQLVNDWTIVRRRVSGDDRIEIKGLSYADFNNYSKDGVFSERIDWNTRFFIPANREGVRAIRAIIKDVPVLSATPPVGAEYGAADGASLFDHISDEGGTYEIQGANAALVRDRSGDSGVQLQLFTNAEDGRRQEKFIESYPARIGTFYSDFETVENAAQAAQLLSPIAARAQEVFAAVVLDKDKKPIAVLQHSIGTTTSNQVAAGHFIGSVHNLKGADSVWIAHNHPSGRVTSSPPDRELTKRLDNALQGTGVSLNGHVIMTPTGKATLLTDTGDQDFTFNPPTKKSYRVGVTERRLRGNKPELLSEDAVASSALAKEALKDHSLGLNGILFLDSGHRPIRFMPVTLADMQALRRGEKKGLAAKLYRFIDKRNSVTAAIVNMKGGTAGEQVNAGQNLVNFFAQAGVNVLDIIAEGDSLADQGVVSNMRNNAMVSDFMFHSRGRGRRMGTRPAQVLSALRKFIGNTVDGLVERGKLEVVRTDAALPDIARTEGDPIHGQNGAVVGAYHKGKIWLVADRMTPEDAKYVFIHEAGHALLREDKQFVAQREKILARFERLKGRSERVKVAFDKVPNDTPAENVTEEALMYFLQDKANHKHSIFRRIVAAVKAALVRLGIQVDRLNLGEADFVALFTGGVKRWEGEYSAKKTRVLSDVEIIEAGAFGNPSGLTAPRGAPTIRKATSLYKILASRHAEVKSAAESASKVADENGEPVVIRYSRQQPGPQSYDNILNALLGKDPDTVIKETREEIGKEGLTVDRETKHALAVAAKAEKKPTPEEERSWWERLEEKSKQLALGALTLRQIRDIFGPKNIYVARFYQATRDMAADTNQMMAEADKVYNQFAALPKDIADELADIMTRATIDGVDPSKGYRSHKGKNPSEERIARDRQRRGAHNKLKARFGALAEREPRVREVWQNVRQTYDTNLQRLRDALLERLMRTAGRHDRRILKEFYRLIFHGKAITPATIEKLLGQLSGEGRAVIRYMDQVRLRFEKYIKEGPYFPLSRFGPYVVVATKKGQPRQVRTFETMKKSDEYVAQMKRDGWSTKETYSKNYSMEVEGVSSSFVEGVIQLIDGSGMERTEKMQVLNDLNQLFIQTIPDLSHRKHFAHRQKIEGYSRDQLRAFAETMQHAAHHISRIRHADKLTTALREMDQDINKSRAGNQRELRYVWNELSERLEKQILKPNIHPVAQAITSLGFAWNIGPSIASALVNLSQTPLVAYPMMAARFKARRGAAVELTKASNDYFHSRYELDKGFNMAESARLTEDEREMIKKLIADGTIDVTQAHSLAQAAAPDYLNLAKTAHGHKMLQVMRLVSYPFHVAEVANRQITALAAYRLARSKGMDHRNAISEARELTLDSHFDYSQANRARFMEGNARRVLFLFKQYSQQMTFLLGRSFQQAVSKGVDPETKRIARTQLAGILGGHFLVSGLMGMPVIGTIADIMAFFINGLEDEDDPFDWEVELRNLLADTVGKTAGEAIAVGPARMIPLLGQWDVSTRMSLGDLWLRKPDRATEGRDTFNQWLNLFAGPIASNVGNMFQGANAWSEGHHLRGIELAMPKAIKDGFRTIRYTREGLRSWNDDTLIEEMRYMELFGQLLGFNPSRVSEMYAGKSAIKNRQTRIERRRQRLINAWVRANRAGNMEAAQEAMEKMVMFNWKNPAFTITGGTLQRSYRQRLNIQARTQQGVYLPARKAGLRGEGRFANID